MDNPLAPLSNPLYVVDATDVPRSTPDTTVPLIPDVPVSNYQADSKDPSQARVDFRLPPGEEPQEAKLIDSRFGNGGNP